MQLRYRSDFGTNSRRGYQSLVHGFNADSSKENLFGRQGAPLYAEKAIKTKKGVYSVWFICHSGVWNNKPSDGIGWANEIDPSEDRIRETRLREGPRVWSHDIRLVFVKEGGHYLFLGSYKEEPFQGKSDEIVYRRVEKDADL